MGWIVGAVALGVLFAAIMSKIDEKDRDFSPLVRIAGYGLLAFTIFMFLQRANLIGLPWLPVECQPVKGVPGAVINQEACAEWHREQNDRASSSPSSRPSEGWLAGAFLIGVAGTLYVIRRLKPPGPAGCG